MYGGSAKSRQRRHAPDRRSCRDTERQMSPALRDCPFDIRCAVDHRAMLLLLGCSLRHSALRQWERALKYSRILSRSENASGVYRTLMIRGVYQIRRVLLPYFFERKNRIYRESAEPIEAMSR